MATIDTYRTKDGKITYRVRVRRRGYPTQIATFPTLKEARKWGTMIEGQVIEGRHFPSKEGMKHTLSDLLTRYEQEVLPLKRYATSYGQKYHLRYWNKKLGHMRLADIQPSHIIACRDALAKTRQAGTLGQYLNLLSHTFTIAVKEWQWIEQNPCSRVSKPHLPPGRIRFLSEDERQRLLTACQHSKNERLYVLVVLALSTGCRRGELLRLTWADVDLEAGMIHLEKTKSGRQHTVPLVGLGLDLLRNLRGNEPNTVYIFPAARYGRQERSFRRAFDNAVKEAALVDFTFHCLRHAMASYLVQLGIPLYTVGAILNHQSPTITAKYAHLSTDNLRDALSAMAARIFE